MSNASAIFVTNPYDSRRTTGIYLYTHWQGHEWPERLRAALEVGKDRWGDNSYLLRIIVSQLFRELADSTTGGGIEFSLCSPDYPVIVLDMGDQTVHFAAPGEEAANVRGYGRTSFDDYIQQDYAGYPAL